ncbi:MAG: ABC transporter ATP-binding protein [Spirochaetes bacterium]|nr:ABC transporter ATP-binding protein [Spirochaetota bacterium]MBU0956504.1 ABC transporter ATP-binding protein [Spirochaetota bacterium]
MITVQNLRHDYEGKGACAVDDISFTINDGMIFGFLGPSGAGKSTVQGLMTGLLALQEGNIAYDGVPVNRLGRSFFQRVGVSFEHPNLYGKLSGLENLRYYAGLFDGPTEDPLDLLAKVGLHDAAGRRAAAYSKGMKQRLVFARALVNKPNILFLDEPTSGLDPSTAERIKELILQKRDEGCTIFLTTHNMADADRLCDVVAFLNGGKIVAMDAPRELKLAYGSRSVRVEERIDGRISKHTLFPEKPEEAAKLKALIDGGRIETMHSQEATLEEIFIKLTGRGLG